MTTTFPRWKNDSEAPFVFNLAKELKDLYNVIVLAPRDRGSREVENVDGIKVERFKYSDNPSLCYGSGIYHNFKKSFRNKVQAIKLLFCQYRAMKRIIKSESVDVINAWWAIPSGLMASFSGKPYITTSAGTDIFALKGPFKILQKRIFKKAKANLVLSSALANEISNRFPSIKPVIVPIGIYPEEFPFTEKVQKSRKVVLFVGRLVEQKGVHVLIEAFDLVRELFDAELWIVGEGEYEVKLKELVREKGIGDVVKFFGSKGNESLFHFYSQADVFVMPSLHYEALGLVLVEAMHCGTPVIASNIGGIPDIVKDNETGLLFEEGNVIDLAEKIEMLFVNHGLCCGLIENGKRHVDANFIWSAISDKYVEVIEK